MAGAELPMTQLGKPVLSSTYSYNGGYDEMCSSPGVIRMHWQELMQALDAMDIAELSLRSDEVQRSLQENGVTHNTFDNPRGVQRAWVVDPIPLLMTVEEWLTLEAGLQQRSRLLNLLLADLYGPRSVIRLGLLPPELIYSHPAFLRPCHESLPQGRRWLIFHGVDLARAADGSVWALGDRAQCPSGAGYALENRIILARVFPKFYRDAPLRRLAGFLEAERTTLASLAFHNRDHPNVVLLTPGPGNPSYYEHAYLANYLSLSLVEGEDLAVRDGRTWLKTLGGLKPVDVILRRVTDDFCDPLELRDDSLLGTPGLLQAVRCGGVAIANALGSGIVENPGLLAFMPQLCRHLLGEDLRLPCLQTWWCGIRKESDYVIAHLDQLMIRTILPGYGPWMGSQLDHSGKAALTARIRSAPHLFVGQQPIVMSTAPVLEGRRLVPQPVMLRGFTVAYGDGYRVMPGGLVRVSPGLDNLKDTVRKGSVSKDLWVLASAPEKHISLLRQTYGPIVVTRDGSDLPSRVAENLYWLGRYGERLDATMRLLRETLGRLLEQEQENNEESCLGDLLRALGLSTATTSGSSPTQFYAIRKQLLRLLTDLDFIDSLSAIFARMLRNGRAMRNHLGDDSWRLLNRLHNRIQRVPIDLTAREACELLEGHLTLLTAFSGLNNETMPHHHGWLFLDIGRFLERVLHTLYLFRLAFVTARNPSVQLWEVVLTTTDNLTSYRRRYRSALHPTGIIDLLLFDEGNPRSIGYQLRRLQAQIHRLPHTESIPYRSAEERLILEAVSTLQLADIEVLSTLERSPRASLELARLLETLHKPLNALSDALTHSHFSHAEVPRQLIKMQ
jgi:uncharacterized circularly permuted ATP-grasp superfamily protein/uncharacterized alpha-E superfamily protein